MNNLFPAVSSDVCTDLKQSQLVTDTGTEQNYLQYKSKIGVWSIKPDSTVVTDSPVIVDAASFVHGWILWRANKASAKDIVPHHETLPPQIPGFKASDGTSVESSETRGFSGLLGETKIKVCFQTNSVGGRRLCDGLLEAVKARVASGEEEFIYPCIVLREGIPYTNDHGTFYNPAYDLVNWVNGTGVLAGEIVDNTELKERRQKKQ